MSKPTKQEIQKFINSLKNKGRISSDNISLLESMLGSLSSRNVTSQDLAADSSYPGIKEFKSWNDGLGDNKQHMQHGFLQDKMNNYLTHVNNSLDSPQNDFIINPPDSPQNDSGNNFNRPQ